MRIEHNANLSRISTFGTGGTVALLLTLEQPEDIAEARQLITASGLPYLHWGGGSNTIAIDGPLPIAIIRDATRGISHTAHNNNNISVSIAAGETWMGFFQYADAQQPQIAGADSFRGLPGTMGGAAAGNAGCFGLEMKDIATELDVYDMTTGEASRIPYPAAAYRWSALKEAPHLHITRVHLQLRARAEGEVIPNILEQRKAKQPPGRSGGSFFRNPSPQQPAGMLIDQAGLKGTQVGGAQISPHHGNFFVNTKGATTADFLQLRDMAIAAVQQQFGITLVPEIRIIDAAAIASAPRIFA